MIDNPIVLQGTQISGSVFGDARLAKRGQRFMMPFVQSKR